MGPRHSTPNVRLIVGTLAEFLAGDRVYRAHEILAPTDYPNLLLRGDGSSKFSELVAPNAIKVGVLNAINATATATVKQIKGGVITSTSAAPVTITLPTATLLAAEVGGKRGVSIEFCVDNSAGANTVTVAVGTGITAGAAVITGGATLTVAAGSVGFFKIYFLTGTTALLYRTS